MIIGCGATGSNLANILVRAGVGYIKLVDRDFIELNNLQRQIGYNESDIEKPKAVALSEKLKSVNSDIEIEAEVSDFNPANADELVKDIDLILDGTDNMSTRFMINDISIKLGIPWIYSGAIGTYGMTMNILPEGDLPCFRCFLPTPPRPGALPTCDTAGILNTVPPLITAYSGTEALKILMKKEAFKGRLVIADVWEHEFRIVEIRKRNDCKCCVDSDFEFLRIEKCSLCVSLCGREAVQVRPAEFSGEIDFRSLKDQLEKSGSVKITEHTLIFTHSEFKITLFKDGRAIITGVTKENEAISIYSKYIGQ